MLQKCKLLLMILALTIGCGFEKLKGSNEESEINRFSNEYVEAFNQENIDKLISLLNEDVSIYDFTAHRAFQGKYEIKEFLEEAKGTILRPNLKIQIQDITFPSVDKAIEKGMAFFSWQNNPEKQVAFQAQLVKKNGSWLINKISVIDIEKPSSAKFDQLKDLNWLIGNWDDANKEDEVDVQSTFKWNNNKNLLIQNFSMLILGQKELNGKQIIAWDPKEKRMRSWIFDSDGGFGEGYWNKEYKSWYVAIHYTLPDGKLASAINIYTPVNENTYTFASINRDVDGNLLPNIGPFKMIRK